MKELKNCVIHVSFDNQRRATTVKWNRQSSLITSCRVTAQFIKALLLSANTEAKDKMAPLYYLVTHCAYLFYYSYLLRDKSWRGEAGRWQGSWAERHAHFFLFIAVWKCTLSLYCSSTQVVELPREEIFHNFVYSDGTFFQQNISIRHRCNF